MSKKDLVNATYNTVYNTLDRLYWPEYPLCVDEVDELEVLELAQLLDKAEGFPGAYITECASKDDLEAFYRMTNCLLSIPIYQQERNDYKILQSEFNYLLHKMARDYYRKRIQDLISDVEPSVRHDAEESCDILETHRKD